MDIRLPFLTSTKLSLTKEEINRKRSSQCETVSLQEGFVVN